MPGYELIGKEERQAVLDIFDKYGGVLFRHGFESLRNNSFKVREFQAAFAKKMGSRYAQAVTSGSAALKVALQALGVTPGDEVVTQCFTFVATVEAILECGAIPVITEIDETLNIDPDDFKRKITPKTKAVVPVHMFGAPADMDAIMRIAKTAGLKVLEDAAQAAGGKYKNKSLGAIADAGAFSFDFGKALTTGEGGMICTADREIFQRCMELADHGHENNPARPRGEDTRRRGGFNYRMTELQGALGLAQLGKLDYIIEQQRKNKAMLIKGIKGIGGLKFRVFAEGAQEAADTLTFTLGSAGKARDFSAKMKQEGLATKNLPDAFSWHFAGTWGHLLSGLAEYRGRDLMRQWPKSCDYLMRTIAMPINVNMPEGRINEIIASLAKIAAEVL